MFVQRKEKQRKYYDSNKDKIFEIREISTIELVKIKDVQLVKGLKHNKYRHV